MLKIWRKYAWRYVLVITFLISLIIILFYQIKFSNEFGQKNDYPLVEYKGAINYYSTIDEISSASQKIL